MNKKHSEPSKNSREPSLESLDTSSLALLKNAILEHGYGLGFEQIGISKTQLGDHIERYKQWLAKGYHADLDYMAKHGSKRWIPSELEPGTLRVISFRLNYLSHPESPLNLLSETDKAYISRYTLGRDYHKLIRKKLANLVKFIQQLSADHQYRAFVDSAPVLERAFAQQAGLGWFGKNTMIINREAGSWFFLGEIYTDLPLPADEPYEKEHCGKCTACLDLCPTNAFVEPYVLDTKRCISYLTIEYNGSIPLELRPLMGNRIFGCDDCQLVCPWNRFAKISKEEDFKPRHQLDDITLLELFQWNEEEFLKRTEGSAIRRAGYQSWQRNISIALGNAPYSTLILRILKEKLSSASDLVAEHINWAIKEQESKHSEDKISFLPLN